MRLQNEKSAEIKKAAECGLLELSVYGAIYPFT